MVMRQRSLLLEMGRGAGDNASSFGISCKTPVRYAWVDSSPQKWDWMLENYYKLMGWDLKTGKPLPETLKKLVQQTT